MRMIETITSGNKYKIRYVAASCLVVVNISGSAKPQTYIGLKLFVQMVR